MTRLIPKLLILRHELEQAVPRERFRETYYQLELLPYCLGSTYQSFLDFAQAQRELVAEKAALTDFANAVHAVGAAGSNKLSYRIDSFLESARRTQNAVIPYISKALSVSLPSSLSDVAKKIKDGKVSLPESIAANITGYWDNHGKKVKDYRDLSQHCALVASEVRIFQSSEGKPAIYMTLPNNPEVMNAGKLIFDKPAEHAFSYLRQQLGLLIRFCHVITAALVKSPPGPRVVATAAIVFRNPLQMGPGAKLDGHHIPSDADLRKQVDDLVAKLDQPITAAPPQDGQGESHPQ